MGLSVLGVGLIVIAIWAFSPKHLTGLVLFATVMVSILSAVAVLGR